MAADFLARARAGAPIRSLLGQPGMPSQTAYRRWKMAQAPFAEAAFALRQRRDAHTRELGLARRRDFNQAMADRIVARLNVAKVGFKALLKADPELPSREVVARWRREQPEFDAVLKMLIAAKRRIGRPVPEAVVQDVVDHIVEGGTFLSYSRQPGGPAFNTLRRWMRDPAFAREVAQACEWREEWYRDQIEMIAERTPPGPLRQMERSIGPLKRQIVRLRTGRRSLCGPRGGAEPPIPLGFAGGEALPLRARRQRLQIETVASLQQVVVAAVGLFRPVVDKDVADAEHREVVPRDLDGGRLVDADAEHVGVGLHHRVEVALPVAGGDVLVDGRAVEQAPACLVALGHHRLIALARAAHQVGRLDRGAGR